MSTPRRRFWAGLAFLIALAAILSALINALRGSRLTPVRDGAPALTTPPPSRPTPALLAPSRAQVAATMPPNRAPRASAAGGDALVAVDFNGRVYRAEADAAQRLAAFRASLAATNTAVVLLGFANVPDARARSALAADGIELLNYVADGGWVARVSGGAGLSESVRSRVAVFASFDASMRVSPSLRDPCGCDALPVYVHFAPGGAPAGLHAALAQAGFRDFIVAEGTTHAYLAGHVPFESLDAFLAVAASAGDVQYIDRGSGAHLLNITSMRTLQSGSYTGNHPIFAQGIYGSNQTIAVCDTGIDADNCFFRDYTTPLPPANQNWGTNVNRALRKVIAVDFLSAADNPAVPTHWDSQGHGTRVSGHALGSSIASPLNTNDYTGMAPGAWLVMQDGGYGVDNCADLPALGCPVTNFLKSMQQASAQGATIHNNSWGDNENGVFNPPNYYTQASRDADGVTWSNREFLVVCAAGNSGGTDIVGSPSNAKNTLSVAASVGGSGQESLASFSSRGWTRDGRIKPDLTAPGQTVSSSSNDGDVTSSNCTAATGDGTSYASPMIAGMAALVRDYFAQGFYPSGQATPSNATTFVSAAMVKAVLINCAMPMLSAAAPPPARDQGWGRVNLSRTLRFTNSAFRLLAADSPVPFSGSDATYKAYLFVNATNRPLKVTLAWSDFPGTPGAGKQLVNDLDLTVRTPSSARLGNVFSNGWSIAGGLPDRTNNVEQINWQQPPSGIVEVCVSPYVIPVATQDFALVATGGIEVWPATRDVDEDALPDYWEAWHFGDLGQSATNDFDGDGLSDYGEFVAGSDPTDAGDVLRVDDIGAGSNETALVLEWRSESNREYALRLSTNLAGNAWSTLRSNLPATPPLNTVTIPAPPEASSFFRIQVQ